MKLKAARYTATLILATLCGFQNDVFTLYRRCCRAPF
jgi:hypothetical protein